MSDADTEVMGRRVAAWLVDWVLFFGLLWVVGDHQTGDGGFSVGVHGGATVVYFAIAAAYFWVWQGLTGATVGKLALGLRVVKEDGSAPPGVPRAAARSVLFVADAFPYLIPNLLGFIVAMTNPRRQRVGDLVAGTKVVRADAVSRGPAGLR